MKNKFGAVNVGD